MKKWGLVVTLLYAAIVIGLLAPVFLLLASNSAPGFSSFRDFYREWGFWMIASVFILGQVVLLSLSVDTTQKRMRPRTPVVVSALTTGLFLMIVTIVVLLAPLVALRGESAFSGVSGLGGVAAFFLTPWVVWGIVFYRFCRNSTDPVTRAVAWLFRGSVLELLIAVPAHVMVRRRHDCCAPILTGFGITSGIAIMLLSFGPSVLLLFKKRMEQYAVKETGVNKEATGVGGPSAGSSGPSGRS